MLSPDLIIGRGESDPRHERVRPGAAAISWSHLDLVTTTSFSPASKHSDTVPRPAPAQAQSGDRSQFLEEALSLQGVRMTLS